MARSIYFISHPNVVVSREVPVTQWPLSNLGCMRMNAGLRQPWVSNITSVYSSGERKAVDGAKILASHLGITLKVSPGLGENDRSATGFLPAQEFEQMADAFFANPYKSIRGWERAIDAQARIFKAVSEVFERDESAGSIAIVSPGAVGTLLYCTLTQQAINHKWDQPANGGGNFFHFTLEPPIASSWWQQID